MSYSTVDNARSSTFEIEEAEANNEGEVSGRSVSVCRAFAGDVVRFPARIGAFYSRLSHRFSWQFVALVSIVYGVNQVKICGYYMQLCA